MSENPFAPQAGGRTLDDRVTEAPDSAPTAIERNAPDSVSAPTAARADAPDNSLAASDVALAAALEADLAQLEGELAALEVPPSS
jgi:hypothetical protein